MRDAGCRGQGETLSFLPLHPASCIQHPLLLLYWSPLMPIVSIDLAWLNRLLGKPYETETLRESLEQIGCDVEDVVEVLLSRCPQCGSLVENPLGQEEVKACGF